MCTKNYHGAEFLQMCTMWQKCKLLLIINQGVERIYQGPEWFELILERMEFVRRPNLLRNLSLKTVHSSGLRPCLQQNKQACFLGSFKLIFAESIKLILKNCIMYRLYFSTYTQWMTLHLSSLACVVWPVIFVTEIKPPYLAWTEETYHWGILNDGRLLSLSLHRPIDLEMCLYVIF